MCQPSIYTSKAKEFSTICPNGADIISSEIAQLDIPSLPEEATTARVFNDITSENLLYIGQMYDSGCTATFSETYVNFLTNKVNLF